jgi:nitroreductase
MSEPLDALEAMATTRAIRRLRPDPIPETDLARILFAATRAPSGSNRQPFRFVVLRDGERARAAKALLGDAFRRGWSAKSSTDGYEEVDPSSPKARAAAAMQHFVDHFESVPVVVLPCYTRYRAPHPSEGASVYPACQNLLLAARALGYGGVITMWHSFVEAPLKAMLAIPDETVIAATIPLGRPVGGGHGPVRRRPLPELVYEDGWGEPAAWAVDPPGTRFTGTGADPARGRGAGSTSPDPRR